MKYQGKKHDIGVKRRSYLLELDLSSTDQEIRDQTLQPICPKPRRLTPLIACNLHSQQQNYGEGRSGIVNRPTDKGVEESSRIWCMGCLVPSCYAAGSPPRRTGNPLVHDVHFINQMDDIHLSPPFITPPTKINF